MKREPLNTSITKPHFQNGGGMLNHTGGTCSHDGMIDCPRCPISELHLGKFPDFRDFQSWKVNFKTEVGANQRFLTSQCTGSKKLRLQSQLTILWHRERLWGETISPTTICLKGSVLKNTTDSYEEDRLRT